jgi:hypothetical protein
MRGGFGATSGDLRLFEAEPSILHPNRVDPKPNVTLPEWLSVIHALLRELCVESIECVERAADVERVVFRAYEGRRDVHDDLSGSLGGECSLSSIHWATICAPVVARIPDSATLLFASGDRGSEHMFGGECGGRAGELHRRASSSISDEGNDGSDEADLSSVTAQPFKARGVQEIESDFVHDYHDRISLSRDSALE